jgi:hypothetical protein
MVPRIGAKHLTLVYTVVWRNIAIAAHRPPHTILNERNRLVTTLTFGIAICESSKTRQVIQSMLVIARVGLSRWGALDRDYLDAFVFDFQETQILLLPLFDVFAREGGQFFVAMFVKDLSIEVQCNADAESEYRLETA